MYWHAGRCVRCAPPLTNGGTAVWLSQGAAVATPGSPNGACRCPGHPLQGALGTCEAAADATTTAQGGLGSACRDAHGVAGSGPGSDQAAPFPPGVREAALRCSARPVFDRVPRWHKAPARGGRSTSARRAASGGGTGAGRGGAAREAHSPRGPAGGPALCPARAASHSRVEEPRLKRERAHGPSGA